MNATVDLHSGDVPSTVINYWQAAASIIMMTSVTRPCFTTPDHQDRFWSQTGIVLRPPVSDHTTDVIHATFIMQHDYIRRTIRAYSCDVHSIETRRPLLSFYTDSANARGTCKYSVTCSVYNGSSPVAARSRLMSTARGDVTTYAIARSHWPFPTVWTVYIGKLDANRNDLIRI